MKTSETISKLAGAIAAAQTEMRHPRRSASNPALRNKFADLSEVIDTVKPVLLQAGVVILQTVDTAPTEDGADITVTVTTRLVHAESGEWIEQTAALRAVHGMANAATSRLPGMNNLQAVGSAITYLRRYALSAIAGVASDPDDDGNEVADNGAGRQAPAKPAAQQPPAAPKQAPPITSKTPPPPSPPTPPTPQNGPTMIPAEIPSDRIAGKNIADLSDAQIAYLLKPLGDDPAAGIMANRLGPAWSAELTAAVDRERRRRAEADEAKQTN